MKAIQSYRYSKYIQSNEGIEIGKNSKGFVLIEILVGLAILAIAMISSMRGLASAADTQMAITQRSLALISADNYLTDIRINRSWPDIGVSYYACPQLNHLFICQGRVIASPNPLFRRIEVTVYQANPSNLSIIYGPRLAWLTTVVPNWGAHLL